ncbi:MAG: DUF5682 family protein [Planctomycetota bacterium]
MILHGVRHHGPGCARSLVRAFDRELPDVILLEGPPDAQDELVVASSADVVPPVALVVYDVLEPRRASFYPFAEFSPEWQAIRWAAARSVPVRFVDLPCAIRFARDEARSASHDGVDDEPTARRRPDPLDALARADGYADGERWWNDRVEETGGDVELFGAIADAMHAVREEIGEDDDELEALREAHMRREVRRAEKDGFERIAVVCGAWHVPAFARSSRKEDDALLKGLAKRKVSATWTPWSYSRLTSASGYGAGVAAPGWYEHLWRNDERVVESWMSRAARVLRDNDLDASSASVVEAVRLGSALAALRGRPLPGVDETTDSMRAVFCRGESTPLALLNRSLLVGDRMGELPPEASKLPLERDLLANMRRLRIKQSAATTTVAVDLREEGGRAKSVFLHRLLALGVRLGEKVDAGGARGTFKEVSESDVAPRDRARDRRCVEVRQHGRGGRRRAPHGCARGGLARATRRPPRTVSSTPNSTSRGAQWFSLRHRRRPSRRRT